MLTADSNFENDDSDISRILVPQFDDRSALIPSSSLIPSYHTQGTAHDIENDSGIAQMGSPAGATLATRQPYEAWPRRGYRYYNTVVGLTMGWTAALAGDLACFGNTRRTLDPNYIEAGEYDIIDYAIWCAIAVHLGELTIARLGVLSSRAGQYYDAHFGPSTQQQQNDVPVLTRLSQGLRQIGLADASKFIFAVSESFIFVGSSVLMFQTLFEYLFTTVLKLSTTWSWSLAFGITGIQLPALILNMLAFLHEADKSAKAKPLSRAAQAGVITVSATTAVGSTLNDIITYIHLYVTNLSKVLNEGLVTKISIYSSIAFVSVNAFLYRLIKQWFPRLSDYLPNMPQHICGRAHTQDYHISYVEDLPTDVLTIIEKCIYIKEGTREYLVRGLKGEIHYDLFSNDINIENVNVLLSETARKGYTPKEKSSLTVAAELMVALFKLITTFFNMLATLYSVMRLGMTEITSFILSGMVALIVGVFSMISIASTYYKMPAKETSEPAREDSPVPRSFSPSERLVVAPDNMNNTPGYYGTNHSALLFHEGDRASISTLSCHSTQYGTSSSSDADLSDDDISALDQAYEIAGESPEVRINISGGPGMQVSVSINGESTFFSTSKRSSSSLSRTVSSSQIDVSVALGTKPDEISWWETCQLYFSCT